MVFFLTRRNAITDPIVTPIMEYNKPSQVPKIYPPTNPPICPGIGEKITCKAWSEIKISGAKIPLVWIKALTFPGLFKKSKIGAI